MATIISRGTVTNEKLISAGLWTAHVLLATVFAAAAIIKLSVPMDRLVETMAWAASVPSFAVRLLGVVELLGAVALMLPTASRLLTRVAAGAAGAFVVMMMVAAVVHLVRGEPRMLPVNLLLGVLAAFVAWGRVTHWSRRAEAP